jgi:mono/diheme cytochrome c family protein
MSAKVNRSVPLSAEAAEPKAGQVAVPVWLLVLLFLILYGGMVYFDRTSGWFSTQVYAPYRSLQEVEAFQPVTGAPGLVQLGLQVYNKPTCVACHQANGKGVPGQFPPLIRTDWVLEPEPGRIIRAVLDGLSGPIQVEGQSYNGAMVPWRGGLTDEEIAAVLTYVRQNPEWGNKAPEVKPERVKEVREKTKNRNQPYSPEELLKISPAD